MRYHDHEPEELEFLDLATDDDGWTAGFHAGKAEILDTLIPEALALVAVIRAEDLELDYPVDDLVDLIERWAAHYESLGDSPSDTD